MVTWEAKQSSDVVVYSKVCQYTVTSLLQGVQEHFQWHKNLLRNSGTLLVFKPEDAGTKFSSCKIEPNVKVKVPDPLFPM